MSWTDECLCVKCLEARAVRERRPVATPPAWGAEQLWKQTAQRLGQRVAALRGQGGTGQELVERTFARVAGEDQHHPFQGRLWTTAKGEAIPYPLLETSHVKNIIERGEEIIASIQRQGVLPWSSTVHLQKWIRIVNEMNQILHFRG